MIRRIGPLLLLVALVLLPLKGAAAPGDVTWRALASTFTPRTGAVAARLGDEVYVVGGLNVNVGANQGYLAVAERYDPATRTWLARTPMSQPRNRLGAAAMPDGTLYAVGGVTIAGGTPAITSSVERYDPNEEFWTARAPLTIAREGHGLAQLNGRLYAIGGNAGPTCCTNTVEEYDPSVDAWRTRAPLAQARTGVAAAVSGGLVYAIGGSNNATTFFGTTASYDPLTNAWTTRAVMPTSRHSAAAATAPNGRIYVAGGSNATFALTTFQSYDPATNSWTTRAALPRARTGATMTAGTDGKLYLFGGVGDTGTYVSQIDVYDPAEDSWTTTRSLPTARVDLAVAASGAGRLYAIGGSDGASPLSTVEELDPATGAWTSRVSMPTARSGLGAAYATNGRIYAVGGRRLSGVTGVVEEYNPTSDSWSVRRAMTSARERLGVTAAPSGRIYAIGGKDAASVDLAAVEEYNPATNLWTARADMPTARSGLAVATGSNGRIYAVGGIGSSGYLKTVEEYDPAADAWSTGPELGAPRTDLALVATADSRLYAIGGRNGDGPLDYVEMLDLNNVAAGWQLKQPLLTRRSGIAASVPSNGKIYVVGGTGAQVVLADVEEGAIEPPAGVPATATQVPTATPTGVPDPWPQVGHDARHTGRSASRLPGAVSQLWRYDSGDDPIAFGPVVGPDRTIYASGGGYVFAVNPNGTAKWRALVGAAAGPPAVGPDGNVYVAAADVGTLEAGTAIAYSYTPDGALRWSVELLPAPDPDLVSPPSLVVGLDGTVYVGVQSAPEETTLHALNPTTGASLWTEPPRVGLVLAAAPAVANGFLYVGNYQENGRVEQVSSATTGATAGAVLGVSEALGFIASTPAIAADGTIYVGSSNGIHALTSTGLVRWTVRTHAPVTFGSPAIGADGTVYIGAGDRMYAVSAGGALKWSVTACLREGAINSAPAIGADGSIVFHQLRSGAEITAVLCALDETGVTRWQFVTQRLMNSPPRLSSPAIGGDGLVYVGAPDGSIYAVQGPVFRGLAGRVMIPLGPRSHAVGG